MDKILTTDVYVPVESEIKKGSDIIISTPKGTKSIRLYTGMIVLTVEQFEKIVRDAFDAGKKLTVSWDNYFDHDGEKPTCPDQTEYIANLLDNRPTVENPMDYAIRLAQHKINK